MANLLNLVVLFVVLISGVLGWDIANEKNRHSCQSRTRNPLEGCGGKALFVDAEGNGTGTGFKTVHSGEFLLVENGSSMQTTAQLLLLCQITLVR